MSLLRYPGNISVNELLKGKKDKVKRFVASRENWSSGDGKDGETNPQNDAPALEWKVWLKLCYDPAKKKLECTLFRACTEPFKPIEPPISTGIFAQVCLLPEETQMKQSQLYNNTGSPSFDESFIFDMIPEQLRQQLIRITLYEQDEEQTRKCLGHAFIGLAELNLGEPSQLYVNKVLQSLPMPDNRLGEAQVCLLYNSKAEKLTLEVKGVRKVHLPTSTSTLYQLRVQVIVGSKTVKSKRAEPSSTLEGALQFSYTMRISHKHMDAMCLRFVIVSHNGDISGGGRGKPKDWSGDGQTLGHFIIGPCMYTHGGGLEHWKQMLANIRKPIERWHTIVNGAAPIEFPLT